MKAFTSWKGLTRDNHIGAIFGRAPQKATNIMVQLLAQHRGKSLDSYLQRFPVKYFETDDEYTWEVIGSSRRNIPLVEAREMSDQVLENTGKRFSWEYAPVEDTMSLEVGDVRYTSSTAMRNEWSHIRIQTKVPGNILDKKLAIGIPFVDKAGNKQVANSWIHHVDYKLEETFSEYKSNIIMFGRSNRNKNGEYLNFGKSGNVIKMGDGIRAQMSVGNTRYYTKFSLKTLEDALFELSESKLD